MLILKVVRPVKLGNEILQPGSMFRAQEEGDLVTRGYARALNKEENKVILDRYAGYAEKLFQGEKKAIQEPPKKCDQGRLF